MPINSNKGLKSAVAAPFAKRYQLALDRSEIDYAWDSDFNQTVADPTGTFETELIGQGTSPAGAGLLKVGGEAVNPQKKTVVFNLAANGSLGTQTFYIADKSYLIWGITEVHKTAGTDAAAVTGYVSHETGTQAAGGGTSVMTGTFNLKGTAATVQTATLAQTPSAGLTALSASAQASGYPIILQKGDRLSFVTAGTLTTLAGVVVTVTMTPGSDSVQAAYFVNANGDLSTQTFFIAPRPLTIARVDFIWGTNFASGVTLNFTKDTGTTAAGGGTSILSSGTAIAVDGTGTAVNTVNTPALTSTAATLQMAPGDRLAVKWSATTTGAGVCAIVTFAPVFGSRKEVTLQIGPNSQQQVSQYFFTADRDYEVIDAFEVHGTAAGGAATLKLTIDSGTTAPGGGIIVDSAVVGGASGGTGFSTNGTAATVQEGNSAAAALFTFPLANRTLTAGSRLSVLATGAAGSTANMCLGVSLKAV